MFTFFSSFVAIFIHDWQQNEFFIVCNFRLHNKLAIFIFFFASFSLSSHLISLSSSTENIFVMNNLEKNEWVDIYLDIKKILVEDEEMWNDDDDDEKMYEKHFVFYFFSSSSERVKLNWINNNTLRELIQNSGRCCCHFNFWNILTLCRFGLKISEEKLNYFSFFVIL